MTEIRCPMCGKPNPYHLDVCKFCQARLRPLVAPSESSSPPKPEEKSDSGLPDWVSSMRQDMPEEDAGDEYSLGDDGEDALDWLNRIQDEPVSRVDRPLETESESPFEEESETPEVGGDWLQRIRSLQQEDPQDAPESRPEEQSVSPFTSDFEFEEEELDAEEGGIPDWLSDLHADQDESSEPDARPAQEIPDWFSEMGEASLPTSGPEEGAEIPDWLSDEPETSKPAAEAEIPDWLSGLEGAETAPAEQPAGDIETPDWLADLGAAGDEDEADAQVQETGLPDWLSEPQEESAVPQSQPEPEAGAPDAELETPDWFSDLESGEDTSGVSDDDLPDWFSDLAIDGPFSEPEAEAPAESEELPDWLSGVEDDFDAPEISFEAEPLVSSLDSGEEMPGWLRNLGNVVTGSVEEETEADIEPGPVSPFVSDEAGKGLLGVEDLPDWLTDEKPDKDAEEDSDLAPAELPGWLAAMRPVESAVPGIILEADAKVESAGPLAGLRGVLSAEPEVADFVKKPPVYTLKLSIPENQQSQAALFENLISEEGVAGSIPHPSLVSSQRILRWLIALAFFVVVGIIVIGGGQRVPMPSQSAVTLTSRLVNSLPEQAPVLLAFDYEPGMAGEMNAAAAALVDHLMLQGCRLTLVSSLPTGPAMAEYFIQTVQGEHSYTSGLDYINLGYIPGGATGLQSLNQPLNLVFSLSYDGMSPWGTPPLQGIGSLSDFAMVVVIADDSDVARNWVEQVQPQLENTPLVMVVSAKSEPMVRPYFNENGSAPVQGLVSGLMGGAAYEVAMGQGNLGRNYWDAFSIGLILAVAAILIGGVSNLITTLAARIKEARREAQ